MKLLASATLLLAVIFANVQFLTVKPAEAANGTPRPTHTATMTRTPRPTFTPSFTRTPRPTRTLQTIKPSATRFVCPRTCKEAVARGVSAKQSALCGLDRDRDGVACYGD
jgi:hypothetical protein